MQDKIDKLNSMFLDMMNDINQYLNDDSVPMECYADDVDRKLNEARMEMIDMLEEFTV